MRGLVRWHDGVGGVEVGVERRRCRRRRATGFRRCGGGRRRCVSEMACAMVGWALISTKVPWVSSGRGDGLAEPHGVGARWRPSSRRRATVAPSMTVEMNGIVGVLGVRSASAERSSGRIGSISALCDATSMFTRRAKRSCAVTMSIRASTSAGGPCDHGLARRGIHRQADLRGSRRSTLWWPRRRARAAPPRPGRPAATSTATGSRSAAALRRRSSAPATTAADTSPSEWPITASGVTPVSATVWSGPVAVP